MRGLQEIHGNKYYERIMHELKVICTKANLYFNFTYNEPKENFYIKRRKERQTEEGNLIKFLELCLQTAPDLLKANEKCKNKKCKLKIKINLK